MINWTHLRLLSVKIKKFESENQLKFLNFGEKFENMSNLMESISGRCQKNHICPTYLILVYSKHCNQLTPSLLNA